LIVDWICTLTRKT
jgi:hypothetical protein